MKRLNNGLGMMVGRLRRMEYGMVEVGDENGGVKVSMDSAMDWAGRVV